ncbi:MAG TPA: hypothetical protein VF857_10370, partial [Spirochaetota bacterium]
GRLSSWSTDHLSVWIDHLLVCASGISAESVCIFDGMKWKYEPVTKDEAYATVLSLAEVYHEGLNRAVHFFPKSSYAYAEELLKSGDSSAAFRAARKAWFPDPFRQGSIESDDPYHRFCFGNHPGFSEGTFPLDDEFERLAQKIFIPLLSVREETHE